MGTGRFLQRCWETERSFYASGAICCLSTFYFFCLPLSWTSLPPPPPPTLLVSLSRTFIKGALLMVETVVGPAWTPALPSLAASTRQSLFCRSLVLIGLGRRRVHSFSQIGFVYCAFHVMCVLKRNLTAVAFLPFPKITLEGKTAERSMIWFLFFSWVISCI